MTLKNKTALITGATGGIGKAIAESIAGRGANIVVAGRKESAATGLAKSLADEFGIQTLGVGADLTEENGCRILYDEAAARFGAIDILVNSAGIQHVAPIAEFDSQKWNEILTLHLTAAFQLSKLSVPDMRRSGWGRIINISSVHGLVASPFKSAYVAAKHGLNGLTKVIALETAEDGITCNAVCPGYVWTPLVEGQIEQQAAAHGKPRDTIIRDVILAPQPNKKFIEAAEVGELCAFLCSDSAQGMTGQTLTMDGGWTAR